MNMSAINNIMQQGSVLAFKEAKQSKPLITHSILNVLFYNQSFFGNNTSIDGLTSSIYIEEKMPWFWIRFNNVTFMNNFGVITNEIYGEQIKRFEFFNSSWGQKTLESNPKMQAIAKFLLIDKYFYEVNVQNSTFDCNIPYDENIILTMNEKKNLLEPSLVKVNVSAQNSFYSNIDRS